MSISIETKPSTQTPGWNIPDRIAPGLSGHAAVSSCRLTAPAAAGTFRQRPPAPVTMSASAVFSRPVVRDAADRGHEQHACRHDGGEHLGVMAGAARHAQRPAAGKGCAGLLRWPAGRRHPSAPARRCGCVPRRRCSGPARRPRAAMLRSRSSSRAITAGSSSRIWNSISAAPGMMLGAPGSSVMRPVVHTVRGPQAAGKAFVDSDAEPRQRQAGVLANGHPRGAGVVLFAGEGDAVLPDPDDGGDDADLEAAAFERLALFDMGFEISDVPAGFGLRARRGRRGRHRAAHRAWSGRRCGRAPRRYRPR